MCGIAGIISPNAQSVQEQHLQKMGEALAHRGQNGQGFFINSQATVGLAHRRLSIFDVSTAANQPFSYLHYHIVFNGAIYNYIELREQLHSFGYQFTTTSDTEVLVACMDKWGKEALNKLDGMFAFALHNKHTDEVLIARDRFGEKPLYYYADYGERGKFSTFLFASEMKALWQMGAPKYVNGTMLLNYLTHGMLQNPLKPTATFYNDVLQLPPGHLLEINTQKGKVKMSRWYNAQQAIQQHHVINKFSEQEAIEELHNLLKDSISKRLRSDVSVGMSLSGGIDSSAIVALAANISNQTFNTFSAIFPGFEKNEASFVEAVVAHHKQRLSPIYTSPTVDDLISNWSNFMYHQEEPVQSSSVFTQYMVYKQANKHNTTVLLDGQGADEVLGGYTKYTQWYLQALWLKDKKAFFEARKLLQRNEFLPAFSIGNIAAAYYPKRAANYLQKKAVKEQQKHAFINQDFLLKYSNVDTLQKPIVNELEDLLYYNTFKVGLPELLRYADKNSMAFGREIRLPYLQHTLVEKMFCLPANYKMNNGYTKWILRKAVAPYLPESITWRKGKVGYEPPQANWMQHKAVKALIQEGKEKLVKNGVLKPTVLQQSIIGKAAHEINNFNWRYLSAAAIIP